MAAPVLNPQTKVISIGKDKSINPKDSTIVPGDLVLFEVDFPQGKKACKLTICAIDFEDSVQATTKTMMAATSGATTTGGTPMGTIKIGS